MYELKRIENHFNDIREIKDFLKSKIFVSQNRQSYVFDDDAYAMLQGDFSLLILRNNIAWKNINTKYKYSIFQYESNFIFRTYDNEISPKENEFIISIIMNQDETCIISFFSLEDKSVKLKLLSD
jgi:hypothetical protein